MSDALPVVPPERPADERAVRAPGEQELGWLAEARRRAGELLATTDPVEHADARARLAALAQAAPGALGLNPSSEAREALVGVLGVALGDALAERHGLAWAAVEEDGAVHLSLTLPGRRLRVNPISTTARNLRADGTIDLAGVLESVSTVLTGGAASAASSGPDAAPRRPGPAPADEAPAVLSMRGVTKAYKVGGTRLEVLKGVDLDVRSGEILAVLGKSGCGKSTLLHVLGWLDRADAGEIRYDGVDRNRLPAQERARQRNRVMGFVFQFYHLMPELSALENVLLPALILHDRRSWRRHERAATERAKALLAMVGLGPRMGHRPRQLSGGERQRVAIARALQNSPRFLLCDEPTGNLDGRTAEDVRALLWGLNRTQGQTMVIVTHDARLADEAHRTIHLEDGRVVEGARSGALVETLPDA